MIADNLDSCLNECELAECQIMICLSTFVLLGVSIILSNRNNSQLYIRCFSMFTGLAELSKIFKLCKPLTSTEQVYIAQEPYIIISISLSMVAHQDKCLVILAKLKIPEYRETNKRNTEGSSITIDFHSS